MRKLSLLPALALAALAAIPFGVSATPLDGVPENPFLEEPLLPTPPDLRPRPTRSADAQLAVERIAKVSFNEALDSYHDLAMIFQTAEGHGRGSHSRMAAWLYRHSGCVTGRLSDAVAARRPGNCRWSRNLTPNRRMPLGWDVRLARLWHHRIADRWLRHLDRTRLLVDGDDPYRPCPEAPTTWDGVRYGEETVTSGRRRIIRCLPPYTSVAGEIGLHNYGLTSAPPPTQESPGGQS